jgi:hypothetical protein
MVKERQWQPEFGSKFGLKQGYAITNMPPGSCLDIKNMYLNGIGGKTPRGGYTKLFRTTEYRLAAGAITGTPVVFATLLQAVTGATARVIVVGTGYFGVRDATGTFNTTNVVTGTNPDATTFTFTPSATLAATTFTDRIRSMIQFSPFGGTVQNLAYSGTRMFKQIGSTAVTDIIRGGLTNDTPWEWLQYRDKILGVNGTDTSFLYNGTTYSTISITKPSALVTTADGGVAGTLIAGDSYGYIQTNYDSTTGRESEPFSVVDTGTHVRVAPVAPNGSITSTFVAVTSGEGVTHRRLYRKKINGAGAETLYNRIAEVAVATATYTDTGVASTTLYLVYDTGAQDTGNTAHPASTLIAECFDRIFMVDPTDPSILVYSKIGNYWAFPSGNYYYVGRGDGSRIKRIEKHGKALLIHKGNAWYILENDPAATSNPGVVRMLSKIGTQDYRCSISAHNQVLRVTPVGFYRSVPTDYSTTDLREDYIGQDIADFENALDYSNSNLTTMYNYNAYNRRHIYTIEPVSASFYSKCYVYDIVLEQWVYYEIGTDVFSICDYTSDGRKYAIIGDGYGIVWLWDQGNADGINIDAALLNGSPTSVSATTLTDTTKTDVRSTATGPGTGTNTLADTTKTWVVNQWLGKPVYIHTGTGAGQSNTIASNTANELTCDDVWGVAPDNTSQYHIGGWTVDELIGVMVATWEGLGGLQRRRITANTSDTITVATWSTNPDTTTTYTIGGIERYAEEYWDSNGDPHRWKRMRWIVPYVRQTGNYDIEISMKKDFHTAFDQTNALNLSSGSSLWGVFEWGAGFWSAATANLSRLRLHGKYHYYSIRYRNLNGNEPFYWDGHGAVFQVLHDRNK